MVIMMETFLGVKPSSVSRRWQHLLWDAGLCWHWGYLGFPDNKQGAVHREGESLLRQAVEAAVAFLWPLVHVKCLLSPGSCACVAVTPFFFALAKFWHPLYVIVLKGQSNLPGEQWCCCGGAQSRLQCPRSSWQCHIQLRTPSLTLVLFHSG